MNASKKLVPFVLIFAFAYFAGRAWNRPPSSDKASKVIPAFTQTTDNAVKPAADFPQAVSKNQGTALFKRLSSEGESLQAPWSQELRSSLEQRLFSPYSSNLQVEVTGRLGVLKALGKYSQQRAPNPALAAELSSLYKRILANQKEHWLVKRQAFQNFKSLVPAKEFTNYYATLDNRVVRLSSHSEAELLQEVLSEKVGSR